MENRMNGLFFFEALPVVFRRKGIQQQYDSTALSLHVRTRTDIYRFTQLVNITRRLPRFVVCCCCCSCVMMAVQQAVYQQCTSGPVRKCSRARANDVTVYHITPTYCIIHMSHQAQYTEYTSRSSSVVWSLFSICTTAVNTSIRIFRDERKSTRERCVSCTAVCTSVLRYDTEYNEE